MHNVLKTQIRIADLQQGMTVEYEGSFSTVGKQDIKRGGFMGTSFRGDASKKTITRVQFIVPTAFGTRLE